MLIWTIELTRAGSDSYVVGVADDGSLTTVSKAGKRKAQFATDTHGSRAGASRAALRALRTKTTEGYTQARTAAVVELAQPSGEPLVAAYREHSEALAEPADATEAFQDALANLTEASPRTVAKVKVPLSGGVAVGPATIEEGGESSYKRLNGEDYYPRIVGGLEDVAIVRRARSRGRSVCTFGAPGCGKTALFEAAVPDIADVTLVGSRSTEYSDFVGRHLPDPEHPGSYTWLDGPLPVAMTMGLPFFVDELALIDPQETSVLFPLMDGRGFIMIPERPDEAGGPKVVAQPGFCIFGAFNPYVPGARMSEALWSRFDIKLEYTTDYALARGLGVPAGAITAAIKLDEKLRNEHDPISWAPQMRELIRFREMIKDFGEDFALSNFVAEAPIEQRAAVELEVARHFPSANVAALATGGAWAA